MPVHRDTGGGPQQGRIQHAQAVTDIARTLRQTAEQIGEGRDVDMQGSQIASTTSSVKSDGKARSPASLAPQHVQFDCDAGGADRPDLPIGR
ncbi:hypothetical protein HEK131_30900 [Streptomyces seoulensis]|nr:hypothetical protein HEK131_30900 [Streptomyces seoulensis]